MYGISLYFAGTFRVGYLGVETRTGSFGYFLRDLLRERGIKPADLARRIGRTERSVYNWLASARPPRDAAALLSDALHVPLDRMRDATASSAITRHSGDDTPSDDPPPREQANYDAADQSPAIAESVACFESVSAGTLGLRDVEQLSAGAFTDGRFKVRISGRSMEPDYPDTCWVTFSRPKALGEGLVDQKDYLVWTLADESTFKRVTRDPDDPAQYLLLLPLNPDRVRHPVLRLHRREIAYLARALTKEIRVY